MPGMHWGPFSFSLLTAVAASAAFGQTVSSAIVGTLTDPGNALVPNAQITLTGKATGATRAVQSNGAGLFRFLDLNAGEYSLQVKAPGFKTFDMSGILLASAENRDLGTLVLRLGSLTGEVSVTAQATPVQTAGPRFGPAKYVLNNWVLSGVVTVQTGAPVSPACFSISAGPQNSDPSLSGGGARCQVVANPDAYQHTFFTNFNTAAFTLAPPGTFGNIGLNILHQPSWNNFDVALDKRIQLGKDIRRLLRLRIEAFNVFNHAEFSTIGTTLTLSGATNTNTTYGQYTATDSPRQMSTTLRFEF